jgi:hypothetical protein
MTASRATRSWGRRLSRATLAAVVVAAAVAALTATGLPSAPASLIDGNAWLIHGRDLVHASSSGAKADWLLPEVLAAGAEAAEVSQDGDVTLVVDVAGGSAFSIDAVTLEASDPVEVADDVRPYVSGGQAYLVGDGVVRWLDPATFEEKASIAVPGTVSVTIDGDGILWVLAPRDGSLRRIVRGEVSAEVQVIEPGHDTAITLAGNQPVIHDRDDETLVFVDRRTGRPGDEIVLPGRATLQGPSQEGDRVWLVTEAGTLLGVAPGGDAIEVEVGGAGGELHRPEVVDDRVVVPSEGGTVAVFDSEGRRVGDQPADLPAAAEGDFRTFTKDGVVWFNAPQAGLAGTVDGQGAVHPIEVDEDALTSRREQTPDPKAPITPEQVDVEPPQRPIAPVPATIPAEPPPPPNSEPTPGAETPDSGTPPDSGDDGEPPTATTSPPGATTGGSSTATTTTTTTTTTTRPPTTTSTTVATTTTTTPLPQSVPAPDVGGRPVDEACRTIEAAGLTCTRQPTGQYGAPAMTVLGQAPAAGASVARGGELAISFHESEGVAVPQAGNRGANACGPIRAAGLTCNPVPEYGTDNPTPDEVYGQEPAVGTRVGPGATVNVRYEARPFADVWQVDNPANNQLYLTTDAGTAAGYEAQGWRRTGLGQIFLEPAPGTWVIYCLQPNGTGGNQSNAYIPETMPNLPYHEECGVLGYGPVDSHPKGRSHQVWAFVANSDHFYSTSSSDPDGMAHIAGKPSEIQPIFSLFDG